MTYILGLTGKIASGKSTVASLFANMGAVIISADAIIHKLQQSGTEQTVKISEKFGKEVLNPFGAVNREKLRQIISNSPQKLHELEGILHPAAREEINLQIKAAKEQGAALVVLEVPLMFQTNANELCDSILTTTCPTAIRLDRAQARNPKLTTEEFEIIDAKQLPEEEIIAKADHHIDTKHGDQSLIKQEVTALYNRLIGV